MHEPVAARTTAWWAGARRTRAALAPVAGALPALAFPAPGLWWLAWVALVPWLLLTRCAPTPRQAALAGWLGGTGFMLAVHHWLMPSLHVFILILAALLGALWAPWGWLAGRLLSGSPRPARIAAAAVLLPAGWLMVELIRSWEYLGGPWGLLGASQWQVPPTLRLASVGGVWLLSFAVVAVNTAVTALLASAGARAGARAAGAAVLAVAAVATTAAWAWAPAPEENRRAGTRIAVVQAGAQAETVGERFARSAELTRRLTQQNSRPDLVVWGESSVGVDLGARPDIQRQLASLSARVGAPLLVNVDARRMHGPGIFKSSVLVTPDGLAGERYDKMRLVPFGEYVPARSLLGWATSVGKAAGEDRRRGTRPVVMHSGALRFGPLICFETAFPDMSRHLVRDGAPLLVAQSSTATFQHSWAPGQHASLAALRSAETGRPMVHATLTGVSAVHGARSEQIGPRLGIDRSTAAVYDVPSATGTTLYVRLGDWVLYVSGAALAAYGALLAVRARRAGPRTAAAVANESAPAPR